MNSEQPETDPWTLFIDELYACVHDIESRECLVAMAESLEEQSAVQRGLVRDTANGWQANYAEKDAELLALRAALSQLQQQIAFPLAQLRHAYMHTQTGTVGDIKEFGRWLIGRQIDRIEIILAAAPPHPETEGP